MRTVLRMAARPIYGAPWLFGGPLLSFFSSFVCVCARGSVRVCFMCVADGTRGGDEMERKADAKQSASLIHHLSDKKQNQKRKDNSNKGRMREFGMASWRRGFFLFSFCFSPLHPPIDRHGALLAFYVRFFLSSPFPFCCSTPCCSPSSLFLSLCVFYDDRWTA